MALNLSLAENEQLSNLGVIHTKLWNRLGNMQERKVRWYIRSIIYVCQLFAQIFISNVAKNHVRYTLTNFDNYNPCVS